MKLFIDANIYLDFYEIQEVKPLLLPLVGLKEYVLVTDQVVDEVFRNKLEIANKKFKEYLEKSKISLALPDVLTENAITEIDEEAGKKIREFNQKLKEFRKVIDEIYSKSLEHVSNDKDKISSELSKIFSSSIPCTEIHMAAAQRRKTFGNPPGKKSDPIGDEISWEQLLDYSKQHEASIWVVSKDGDFMTKTINNIDLGNPFLVKEIKEKGLPEFRFFSNLANALKKFKEEIKTDLALPSAEVLEAASRAQDRSQVSKKDQECTHDFEIIPNGVFDIFRCKKCERGHMQYSDECCD